MPAGRPRKPTQLKKLAGNPGKRALPRDEPTPTVRLPSPPRHLSGRARYEWRRLGAQLEQLGLMTTVDLRALELLCVSYDQMRTCQEKVDELGMVVYTPQGYPMTNPWFTNMAKLQAEVAKMLREFGLTPASRSRVQAVKPEAEEDDPVVAWMRGAG